MNILVLGGGDSPERDVSLRSAKAVAKAAREAGFEVWEADPANSLSTPDKIPKETIVFPILHGAGGEDGTLQKELEKHSLPYLGSDSGSSERCFDKWHTLQELKAAGIQTPKGVLVTKASYPNEQLSTRPHVLKIVHGGSSIGTLVVRDHSQLRLEQVNKIFEMENQAVLEELINGIEITIPVLDQASLPPIEVVPPQGGEFDYQNKYSGASQEFCPPPSLTEEQIKSAQLLAEKIHKTMNCRHLSRTDTIMRPDGTFVALEINTIPGLTDQSLFPKAASVAGLSMPQLVRCFVEMVVRDYHLNTSLLPST